MLALEKWGEGRPPALAGVSQLAALEAESVYELCVLGRKPEFRQRVARFEDKRKWIASYRKQAHVFFPAPSLASQFIIGTGEQREAVRVELEAIQKWLSMSEQQRLRVGKQVGKELREASSRPTWAEVLEVVRESQKVAQAGYRKHVARLEKMIRGQHPLTLRESHLFSESQEARFFLLVAMPCWIEHGISASELFRRARDGDFDSLRKLLSIDPYCLEDTKLRREYAAILERSNSVRRKMLAAAASLEPLRRLTRASVKILIAAYIYKLWQDADAAAVRHQKWLWKHNVTSLKAQRFSLTYSSLKKLFDAAYQDLHKEPPPDLDLPVSADAFRKAVFRHLEFWPRAS